MNSHERRVVERRWPHCINVINDADDYVNEVFDWLYTNLGSCWFTRKNNPRWCYRPHHETRGNFVLHTVGVQIYFHKERDYVAFLLKWSN